MSAAAWRSACAEATQVGAQFRRVEFQELTALEFIDADFDGGAQRLQFECVLTAPLLEDSQRVPYGLARILVLTGLDDLLDEGVLLGRQADVPSRHWFSALPSSFRISLMAKFAKWLVGSQNNRARLCVAGDRARVGASPLSQGGVAICGPISSALS